jgi:catechol 2,3-dioxygenase-like lactoylglutathione lyase family enzyme
MPIRNRFVFLCGFVVLPVVMTIPAAAQSAPNPLQLRPHHATAAVADLDRAVRWYQEVLGFAVIDRRQRPDGGRSADLEIPGYGIALVQYPGAADPAPARRSGWVHIVFAVPDPASAYATLKARGADVSTRGSDVAPANITTFLVHDSEGNEIEILK